MARPSSVFVPILALTLAAGPAAASPAPTAGDAARGERAYRLQCLTCHEVAAATPNPRGPHLAGIMDRRPGAPAGYSATPALRALAGPWTAARLDAYLADPRGVAPGTTMVLAVRSAQTRADIIAYLQTLP